MKEYELTSIRRNNELINTRKNTINLLYYDQMSWLVKELDRNTEIPMKY
jgi:hypothetical protein